MYKPEKQARDWNSKHPAGTPVQRFKLMHPRREPAEKTITDGPAWVLSGHSAVVRLKGLTGCYHLDCLEVLT